MNRQRAQEILAAVARFHKLERQNTDEVGWIALHFSVPRGTARRWLDAAQSTKFSDPEPVAAPPTPPRYDEVDSCRIPWTDNGLRHICHTHFGQTCWCPCGATRSDTADLKEA